MGDGQFSKKQQLSPPLKKFFRYTRGVSWCFVLIQTSLELPKAIAMSESEKEKFLFPIESYRGEFKMEKVLFNANLQEFAQRVNFICNLETNGKISSQQAYQEIKNLWKTLKSTRKSLELPDEENKA